MSGTVSHDAAARDVSAVGEADARRCASCVFWRRAEKHPTNGTCCYDPPRVHFLLMPSQSTLAQAQPQIQQVPASVRPTTDAGDFCSRHRHGDEITDAEMLTLAIEEIAKWIQQGITTGGKK